jgi:S1-C subfamily serine protease
MTWDHEPPSNPPNVGQPDPPEPPPAPPAAPMAPTGWEPAPPTAQVPGTWESGVPMSTPPGGGVPPTGSAPWGGAPTPPPERHMAHAAPRRTHPVVRVVVALFIVAGLFGLGFGVRSLVTEKKTTVVAGATASNVSTTAVTIDPGSEPVAYVAATVSPSVVQIETTEGLGSGVVYDNGLIMTNAHVVGNATTVTVRNASGSAFKGDVLGADTGTDIAVVRVNGLEAPAAKLSAETPHVGQIAVAVGSPYGLSQTVTSGIVSAVNRPVDNDKGVVVNMIQTDASINPGNSGGALANRSGEIIGINTAIFSQTGENTGIGFAIPIATAKSAADKLVNGQSVARASLGLSGPSETPNGDAGAYVQSVTSGGAADKAGIKKGDLVVSVDGTAVRSFDELRGMVSAYSPGDTVTVQVVRNGATQNIRVTLGTQGK